MSEEPTINLLPEALSPWIQGMAVDAFSLGGNHPLTLDDPGMLWYVESGQVEVFATAMEQSEPVGARQHYVSASPGSVFFGMDFSDLNHAFIATGGPGTVVRAVPAATFWERLADPAAAALGIPLVDRWVSALSGSVSRGIPRPRNEKKLRPGPAATFPAGAAVIGSKEPVWVNIRPGLVLYLGVGDVFLGSSSLFPLTNDTWIDMVDEAEVSVFSTAEVAGHPGAMEGMGLFHRAICESEFVNKSLLRVDQMNRRRSRAEHRESARRDAINEIAAVMATSGDAGERVVVGDSDPLTASACLVAEASGIATQSLILEGRRARGKPDINDLGAAGRFRIRQIAFRGFWYRDDNGPLLAYLTEGEEKHPVALLPRSATAYDLVDPRDGIRKPVTPELASSLDAFGFSFYRSFRDGAMKVGDVIRFGGKGLGKDLWMVAFMGVFVGLLGTLTPAFSGGIFDTAIPAASRSLLMQYGVALVCAAFAGAAFQVVRGVSVLRIEGRMDYSVQAALWDRLLNLPTTFFRLFAAGDLADRVSGVDAIRQTVSGVGITAVLGGITSVFYLFVMFGVNPMLGLMGVALVGFAMVVTAAANFFQLRHQRTQFTMRGHLQGVVLQFLSGVSKIRVAGAEDHAFKVWATLFSRLRRVSFTVGRIENFVQVFQAGFPVVCSLIVFSMMAKNQVAEDATALSTGDFIAFNAAFGAFLTAMLSLSKASLSLLNIVPIYERLAPIITTEQEITDARVQPGELTGELELVHVNFRYQADGPLILQNVSLKIHPGEFVAFVGPSGSGKSTVLRMLLGFETPESGHVMFDGQDLKSLDPRAVRRQIGVVLQTSRLLPTDIFRNIIGPNANLTIDDAWEAAEKSGLADDVRNMAMGMHTVISEGGGTFSGGQKQRLMIARAIVNRPKVLFFDEATSALDNITQKMVTDSLDAMNATRIVIAHRLSTIINADRIIVLVKGRVLEQGTYAELMAMNGHFAELARRQTT